MQPSRPASVEGGREQLRRARCVDDVRPFEVGAQVLPERRPAEPVEPDRAEHHRHESEHPRGPFGAGEPRERHPEDEPAVVLAERRDPREQAEVDREAVAVLVPGPPAERGHPEPHRVAVERDRESERARARRLRVGELQRREQRERDGAGPDAEPPRVVEGRRPLLAQQPPEPRERRSHREPRVQHRPDIAEQHLQRPGPEPEDDVDERRGEVLADDGSPISAVRKTSTSRPAERAPTMPWRRAERRIRSSRRSGRPAARRSNCRFQSAPSARNEKMRTTAPPQKKSLGTGRSLTALIPWASRLRGEPRARRSGRPCLELDLEAARCSGREADRRRRAGATSAIRS